MNTWSLRCSKLALGKTNKVSVFLANTYSGCPWSGKKSERNHFFQSQGTVRDFLHQSCADPEIFMRGGPTKIGNFWSQTRGVQPSKNREITFF